jgi:hypothetical protein
VPEIVKPKPREAGGLTKRAPGGVPLLSWFGRIELVMLAGAPQVVLRIDVSEFVGALDHCLHSPEGVVIQG